MVFASFILCLVLIDIDTLLLPDELTLPLLWLGLIFNLNGLIAGSLFNAVVGAIVGYTSLWTVFWAFKLTTKKEGMGYGDFKLLAAILAWIGFAAIIPMLLIASTMGILYYIIAKLTHKIAHNEPIAFGPALGISGLVILLGSKYFSFLSLMV
jgi:leader peptidase (prepilin peptidase)/N-methyltransferase